MKNKVWIINKFFSLGKLVVSETRAAYGKITGDEQILLHLFREIRDKKESRYRIYKGGGKIGIKAPSS